jgi:hypothetical protein
MNYDLKIYGGLGLNTRHIEVIDKIYGSVIDRDFDLQRQPKGIKDILKQLALLPASLRPKFIFESSILNTGKKIKSFGRRVLLGKYRRNRKK